MSFEYQPEFFGKWSGRHFLSSFKFRTHSVYMVLTTGNMICNLTIVIFYVARQDGRRAALIVGDIKHNLRNFQIGFGIGYFLLLFLVFLDSILVGTVGRIGFSLCLSKLGLRCGIVIACTSVMS